ncbi:hypothetical protein IL306_012340 [Fusarium sp. DS 682]|nr:hypothetical protein IL306_012340 [Fusarium sp. DS 682]
MHEEDVNILLYLRAVGFKERDHYAKPRPRHRSLLLDTVTAGRPRASQCRLLQLPAEILANIVDSIAEDPEALYYLALVNSDCRNLARASQFSEAKFNYSISSQESALRLGKEIVNKSPGPSIRDCIRHFTYAPHHDEIRLVHWNFYEMGLTTNPIVTMRSEDYIQERIRTGHHYKMVRQLVAANVSQMPNLETLVWQDNFLMDKDTFKWICNSRAHNLVLRQVVIAEAWSLGPPMTLSPWPLRSLDLHLTLKNDTERPIRSTNPPQPHPASNFFETLFPLCSPTLESLKWDLLWPIGPWIPLSLPAAFPRLHTLRLDLDVPILDEAGAASLLSTPLKSLDLRFQWLDKFGHLLNKQEPYRGLENLVFQKVNKIKPIAEFISKHPQLQKLYVQQTYESSQESFDFDEKLVPALKNNQFNNIRSLYLEWGGHRTTTSDEKFKFDIPTEALEVICSMTSLEQLALGCAIGKEPDNFHEGFVSYGARMPQWLINHENLQNSLKNLQNLKKLAFVHDTYQPLDEDYEHIHYYKARLPTTKDYVIEGQNPELRFFVEPEGGDDRETVWEIAHLWRMLQHAEAYRNILPKLEWFLLGQRPVKFGWHPDGYVEPIPLGNSRDECRTFLKTAFGLATEGEYVE